MIVACGGGGGTTANTTGNGGDNSGTDDDGGGGSGDNGGGGGTGYDTGRCCTYQLDGTDSATCGNLAVSNYLDGISWGKVVYENTCPLTVVDNAFVVVQYAPCKGTWYNVSCGGAANCTDGWRDINGAMDDEGRFNFDFEWEDKCYCCSAKQLTETEYSATCTASNDGTYVSGSLCSMRAN